MNVGEADKMVFIFTESLGMVAVFARGARKTSSKLRYSLQNHSFARIALVRGKNMWRLIDAEEISSFSAVSDPQKLRLVVGVFSFVNRFVHGEGENGYLFRSMEDLFGFVRREELSPDEMFLTETIAVCRILSSLGYLGGRGVLARSLDAPISRSLLAEFAPRRSEALREINRALVESHL
jgi:DNA repair protein RecO